MVDYYKSKREAAAAIDKTYRAGDTVEMIIYKIGTVYGFSEKFVKDRIRILDAIERQAFNKEKEQEKDGGKNE